MAHPLDGCREKVKRANEHVVGIHQQIVAGAIKMPPNPVRAQYQSHFVNTLDVFGTHHVVFTFRGDPPPMPAIFGILAGEVVYHLRSALDHLVYQLIVQHTNAAPRFNSAFPVVGRGKNLKTGWRTAPDEYAAQTSALKQVITGTAEALIHKLQPYHSGPGFKTEPLWVLTELNNTDKHRLILLTVHGVSVYAAKVTTNDGTFDVRFPLQARLEHGAEVGRFQVRRMIDPNSEVKVDGELVVNVAFDKIGDAKNVPVIPFLSGLAKRVSDVIESFISEFPN